MMELDKEFYIDRDKKMLDFVASRLTIETLV
jgi:hypothetical protein